jgi:hypothetical protein
MRVTEIGVNIHESNAKLTSNDTDDRKQLHYKNY